ncbi:hypothetical protein [Desulforamulus aquiferis]|uniref:Uncharacterized protein n=1 Tax=Desulforamulus aquiferis TaxID=1397668 RepID=A0AAW7ZC38_9FIRM|nr:hypothetical protein [Desulforamulus aquiferis]MDO7786957.1 hypothetical protein [Desulforamulus aquiferis]
MEQIILAAAGCGQLAELVDISERHHRVTFGSMDLEKLRPLASIWEGLEVPVYFYETG